MRFLKLQLISIAKTAWRLQGASEKRLAPTKLRERSAERATRNTKHAGAGVKTTLVALLASSMIASCGASSQQANLEWSPSSLRDDAEGSRDPELLGRWLLSELISPGGTADKAREAKKQLQGLKHSDMIASFALGLDAVVHGDWKGASEHYLQTLKLARDSEDPRAPAIAWFAAQQAISFRSYAPGLWQRWSAFVNEAIKDPRHIGFRAREQLVDWWRYEAHREAQKDIDDLAADRYGCLRNLRLAGPFGRNSAADTLRSFKAERPGPWPMRFAADDDGGEAARVVKTTRTGCLVALDEPSLPGVFYAESFIDLTKPGELLFAVGSAFRVWIDDKLVLEHDPRKWGTWSEVGVRVRLAAGRHRVLAQLGEPNTSIRVMHPDGRPLGSQGSTDASKAYSLVPPMRVDNANVFDPFVRDGKLIDPNDNLLRFTLAFLANTEGQHDVASALLDPLLEKPDNATGPVLSVSADYAAGDPIFAQSQRRDLMRELHQRAVKKDPKLWRSRLALGLWEAEKSGATAGARELKRLVNEFPHVPEVLSELLRIYNELGWSSEYANTAKELAKRFPEDPEALSSAVIVHDAQGNNAEAERLAARVAELDPDNELRLTRALARQDYKAALEELKRIGKRRPERKDIAERIHDVMVRAGDETESWKKLEAAIKQNPQSERARLDYADASYAAGKRDALVKAVVDAVSAGAPTGELEEALDLIEGMSEMEPYRLDAKKIISDYEASGKSMPGTAARVLDYAAVWVKDDGSSRMLEHEIIKVQSGEAITQMAEQELQRGLYLHVRVIKKDGRVLEPELVEGKPTVTMPHLEVGDYIETERIESSAGDTQRGERYYGPRWFFREENIAYARSEFVVISPKSRNLQIETRNEVPAPQVTENGPLIVHRWRVEESPAAPVEPFGAPITEFLPSVQVGWGVSLPMSLRSLGDALVDLTPIDPRILRIAERIVDPLPKSARSERARRLYRWLVANVQEGEESDGRRVIIGKNGNLWRGYMTLCRALDIPIKYAVAQNRLSVPPRGPFSEASLYTQPLLRVASDKGYTWLAFGGKYTPFGYVPAEARGMPAYLVSHNEPEHTKVPTGGALDNIRYEATVKLAADGSAEVELAQSFHGKYAMGLRGALAEIPEEQVRDVLESRLLGSELRGIQLLTHRIDHFDEPDSPLVIRTRGKMAAFAQRSGESLVIGPPFAPRLAQLAALPARQTPLLMVEAMRREIHIRILLPPGAAVEAGTDPASIRDGDRLIEIKDAPSKTELALSRIVSLPAGRVQPKEYAGFLKFIRSADDALSQSIRVRVRR